MYYVCAKNYSSWLFMKLTETINRVPFFMAHGVEYPVVQKTNQNPDENK